MGTVDYNRESVIRLLRMKMKALKEMPMSELLRLAKTEKGREFLRGEVELMDDLVKQVRLALGESVPERGRESNNAARFDGTVSDLIKHYKLDNKYLTLRHPTRVHYDVLLKRIDEDHGDKKIADIRDRDIDDFYRVWA